MKIVLDANIFISSFFWGGKPRLVLERVINKTDDLFISKDILNEIEEVINRPKFHADSNKITYFIKAIEEIANIVNINKKIKNGGSRDIKDNKYLECAIAGNVDYIVSGDIHLLEMERIDSIKIISANDYLNIIGNK